MHVCVLVPIVACSVLLYKSTQDVITNSVEEIDFPQVHRVCMNVWLGIVKYYEMSDK